jgi:solute carrier family 13 (sodium-dependent dicarboxylate transporter), member 2/3/5
MIIQPEFESGNNKHQVNRLKTTISFIITPLFITYLLLFVELDAENPMVTYTFCVALLMAVWWITEVVPLAVTSLLPVALFPLFGIMSGGEVATTYFNDVIFLFMGGFYVALAMQRWNLHRRIALHILKFTGISPARILLGLMLSSAFLSMWISNTATTMLMLPITISIISQLELMVQHKSISRYGIGLLLGIAYSASIGGVSTLVGTVPNLSFRRIFEIYFPTGPEISFSTWITFALPFAAMMFVITWLFLYFVYKPAKRELVKMDSNTFRQQIKDLGKPSQEEKSVFVLFMALVFLWLFRSDINTGLFTIPGWSRLFPFPQLLTDGGVAIFISVILFLIPSSNQPGTRIMNAATATQLPFHILLLFGGGFALASGFKESGLSIWFGEQLQWVAGYNLFVVILFIALILTFLTELTSNTATTEIILPILAGIAVTTGINPLLLMIPATLSASMAFMMPVASPPNAIIFGTGRISVIQMAKTGFILNLLGALLVATFMYLWGVYVFDIQLFEFPDWAFLK